MSYVCDLAMVYMGWTGRLSKTGNTCQELNHELAQKFANKLFKSYYTVSFPCSRCCSALHCSLAEPVYLVLSFLFQVFADSTFFSQWRQVGIHLTDHRFVGEMVVN